MTNTEESINPLSQSFSLISLLKFAFPSIAMMLFMGLYTIGDTIFVSRFINTDALSAINIVCPVINILVGLGGMIATGGNAIIAKKMGENDKRANHDLSLLVLFSCFISIIIAILGVIFIDNLIWALGASSIQFSYCKDYLMLILIFTPACILQVLFQNLIITAGKPTFGLILSLGAGLANVILDYIFIVPLDMGIIGSALGTVIGYTIPSLIGICFFLNKRNHLHFKKPVLDIQLLIKTCLNGSSEMVSQVSAAITTFIFNITMMKLLGENGVAAITILIYSQFLLTSLYIGFSMGTAPILSFKYGAKDKQQLKSIFKTSLGIVFISSLTIWLCSILFGRLLIQLFVSKSTEVFTITKSGFYIFSFSFIFSGINIYSSAMFTALSNGKISAFISFLRTFFFILLSLLVLPLFLGVNGVWLAIPIAEVLACIVSIICIIKQKTRYHYI